jgi:hypothetical protein
MAVLRGTPNEKDKPLQSVAAERLDLLRNGTVGFIDWLDHYRGSSRWSWYSKLAKSEPDF